MARIGLNLTVTGLTGFLIIRWVKATNTAAEVGRSSAFGFPYNAVYTINGIDPVVFVVQLWRSDDGTALSQLIKDWNIDAGQVNTIDLVTYQYKVDRGYNNVNQATGPEVWADPADADVNLVDERLDGATQADLLVHESGYGHKLDSEYSLLAGGGITLLGGALFNSQTPWFITMSKVVTGTGGGGGSSTTASMFDGVRTLTADQDFDDVTTPLKNRLCIANWGGTVGKIVFPDLTLIADGTHVTFNTHKGSQNYLWLQFDAGDTVRFLNQDVNAIYLAKNERISLYFYGGVCYVIGYDGRAAQRGQVMFDYDELRATNSKACILANESTGELLESDYPGLYAMVEAMVSGKVALGTSAGQWSYDSGGGVYPNKRFFGIQTTAPKKIRVPHLLGLVLKAGTVPGTYEADQMMAHTHDTEFKISKSDETESGVTTGILKHMGAGGGNYGNVTVTSASAGTPGAENRVKSVHQIPYIIL